MELTPRRNRAGCNTPAVVQRGSWMSWDAADGGLVPAVSLVGDGRYPGWRLMVEEKGPVTSPALFLSHEPG